MQRWDPHGPLQSCAWFLHPSCFVFLYGFYRLLFIMFHTFVSFYYYFYDSRFVSTALIRFSFKVLPKILMKLSSCLSNLLFFTVSGHTSHLLCCCLFFLSDLSLLSLFCHIVHSLLHFWLDAEYTGMKCGKFEDLYFHDGCVLAFCFLSCHVLEWRRATCCAPGRDPGVEQVVFLHSKTCVHFCSGLR